MQCARVAQIGRVHAAIAARASPELLSTRRYDAVPYPRISVDVGYVRVDRYIADAAASVPGMEALERSQWYPAYATESDSTSMAKSKEPDERWTPVMSPVQASRPPAPAEAASEEPPAVMIGGP